MNQGPGRPDLLTDRPEKHKLGVENIEYLIPVKFSPKVVHWLRGEVENVKS